MLRASGSGTEARRRTSRSTGRSAPVSLVVRRLQSNMSKEHEDRSATAEMLRGALLAFVPAVSVLAALHAIAPYVLVMFSDLLGTISGNAVGPSRKPSLALLSLPIIVSLLFAVCVYRESRWSVAAGALWILSGVLVQHHTVVSLPQVRHGADPRVAWLGVSGLLAALVLLTRPVGEPAAAPDAPRR